MPLKIKTTIQEFTSDEIKLLFQAYIKGINSPLTSSVGRLFDTIASFGNLGSDDENELLEVKLL